MHRVDYLDIMDKATDKAKRVAWEYLNNFAEQAGIDNYEIIENPRYEDGLMLVIYYDEERKEESNAIGVNIADFVGKDIYILCNITWDCDNPFSLPVSEVEVGADKDEAIDRLTERYGYCIKSVGCIAVVNI